MERGIMETYNYLIMSLQSLQKDILAEFDKLDLPIHIEYSGSIAKVNLDEPHKIIKEFLKSAMDRAWEEGVEEGNNPQEYCKCGKETNSHSSCPYQADVHNDSTAMCNCCDDCRTECAADI